MPAQMTTEASGDGGMPVKRERDTAIWTVARFAAIAAQQRSRKTAAIQEQDCLLSLFQAIGDGLRQFF